MIKQKTKLWSIFSLKIRKRAANHEGYVTCASCLKNFPFTEVDCGHFLENSERKKDYGGNELWYNPDNFAPQCRQCNYFGSAQAKQDWTARWIDKHGLEAYRALQRLKQTPKKWTPEEVNALIEAL